MNLTFSRRESGRGSRLERTEGHANYCRGVSRDITVPDARSVLPAYMLQGGPIKRIAINIFGEGDCWREHYPSAGAQARPGPD